MSRATLEGPLTSNAPEDVSMQIDGSIVHDGSGAAAEVSFAKIVKNMVVNSGKNAINSIVGWSDKQKVQIAFLEILRALSYMFDPHRKNSISHLCFQGHSA